MYHRRNTARWLSGRLNSLTDENLSIAYSTRQIAFSHKNSIGQFKYHQSLQNCTDYKRLNWISL